MARLKINSASDAAYLRGYVDAIIAVIMDKGDESTIKGMIQFCELELSACKEAGCSSLDIKYITPYF